MARRGLLSVLNTVYLYQRKLDKKNGRLWPEVRAELATIADLLPLAEENLRREDL